MSVKYILNQFGLKVGLNPNDTQERQTLLRILNEAAQELYSQSDMVGVLGECLFKINGDQTIAFPSWLGQLRAAREWGSNLPWHINQMRPRYNVVSWPDMWRNYRIKNKHALHTTLRNTAPVTLSVAVVETPNVEVTITGPTATASCARETIVMDSTSKSATLNFLDIESVQKSELNDYDITVSDADGNELAVVPNNQLESLYLHVDVSTFPFLNQDVSVQSHYMEVLFKKAMPWLLNDSDEFPAKGFDNVLVNKCIQIYFEEQGNPDNAVAYDAKATRTLARIQEDENRATQDMVGFVPNQHDYMLPTVRPRRFGRLGGWGYSLPLR